MLLLAAKRKARSWEKQTLNILRIRKEGLYFLKLPGLRLLLSPYPISKKKKKKNPLLFLLITSFFGLPWETYLEKKTEDHTLFFFRFILVGNKCSKTWSVWNQWTKNHTALNHFFSSKKVDRETPKRSNFTFKFFLDFAFSSHGKLYSTRMLILNLQALEFIIFFM